MQLKCPIETPIIPLNFPVKASKSEKNALVGNAIAYLFWLEVERLYKTSFVEKKLNNHRLAIGKIFNSSNTVLEKVKNYKGEVYFTRFMENEFLGMLFFYGHNGKSAAEVKKNIESQFRKLKSGDKRVMRDLWISLSKSVKKNLPEYYNEFLWIHHTLFMHIVIEKDVELLSDLLSVIPAKDNYENELLKIMKLSNLENDLIRGKIIEKFEVLRDSGAAMIEIKKHLNACNLPYEEFKCFLDLYKNFDTGFTNSIKSEDETFTTVRVSLDELSRTFPFLKKGNQKKNYNLVMDYLLYAFESFNLKIIFRKAFGLNDVFGKSDEYSFVYKKGYQVNGVDPVELMEDALLFLVKSLNDNIDDIVYSSFSPHILETLNIFITKLSLEYTIPEANAENPQTIVKW